MRVAVMVEVAMPSAVTLLKEAVRVDWAMLVAAVLTVTEGWVVRIPSGVMVALIVLIVPEVVAVKVAW